ncbi:MULTISPECIES: cytidine deaminase [Anaerolinea]|uniref:cytidine deaminase n=1 Tax=Anaerolinea TaxID=233189 RepID=UPI00261B2E67|nr:cytidine deaminase [Anaerolinea thermophila]
MKLSDEQKQTLIQAALQVRRWAYVPYSNYRVGAALLTESGKIYDGVNVENAAYPATICAERTAVFKAVSEGERHFVAIVVATENGGTPCGSCRQVLAEFGLDIQVIVVDAQGTIHLETTVNELLPGAFTSKQLPPHES